MCWENPNTAQNVLFQTNPNRVKNRDQLVPLLQAILLTKETAYWQEQCRNNNIPSGPIQNLDEVVNDKQLQARNMFITQDHPTAGRIKMIGSPLKLSRTPVQMKYHPPDPGEHNEEIMNRLSMTQTTN